MQAPKVDVFVIGSGIDIIVLLVNITFASMIINLIVVTISSRWNQRYDKIILLIPS